MRSLLTWLLCIALAIPAVPGGASALARTAGPQVTATECCPDDAGSCGDTADCDSGPVCAIRCATPTMPASLPAGTVVVSVAPAAATGKVELASGSQVLSSATLASGQASLAVPAKSLLPGTHQLTLRYLGDDAHKPSSSQVQVTVEKVVPTMKVKAPDRIKRGAKAKVKVKVRAADGVPVTGRVRVAIKGGKTITASLDGGKAVVRLPKAAKGKLKLTITYLGSDLAEQVVDKVTIKVRR